MAGILFPPAAASSVLINPSGDTTGTADTATIQAAINLGTEVVQLGAGTFTLNSSGLTPKSYTRITGQSWGDTIVNSTTGSIINAGGGTLLDTVEIDHMTLQVTGFDLFTGANVARWRVHDCRLIQNTSSKSIWNSGTASLMIECVFEKNIEYVYGATSGGARSVEAWLLTSASGSTQINQNRWRDNVCFNQANGSSQFDTTQWWYHILQTGSNQINGTNSFENIVFEHTYGGAINAESSLATLIDNCWCYDMTAATTGNSLFKLMKNATGGSPQRGTIRNSGFIGNVTLGAGLSHIQLDSNCTGTVIEACGCNAGSAPFVLDIGNSAKVTIVGMQSSYTLLNSLTATFSDVNGGLWETADSPLPADMGYQAWAYDPSGVQGTGTALATAGVGYLIKVPVRSARSITGIRIYVSSGGGTLTLNECFAYLLDNGGNLLGQSADQSVAWTGTGAIDAALAVGTTTVAAGSNGGTISGIAAWATPAAGQLAVASTAGFPAAGTIYVATSTTVAQVTYTGTSGGNLLTGCAYVNGSAAGTVATGGSVVLATAAATPPVVSPPYVYVVLIFNGTTGPTVGKNVAALTTGMNIGKTAQANAFRFATNTTGHVLPSALTLSSNAAGATMFWAALY